VAALVRGDARGATTLRAFVVRAGVTDARLTRRALARRAATRRWHASTAARAVRAGTSGIATFICAAVGSGARVGFGPAPSVRGVGCSGFGREGDSFLEVENAVARADERQDDKQ